MLNYICIERNMPLNFKLHMTEMFCCDIKHPVAVVIRWETRSALKYIHTQFKVGAIRYQFSKSPYRYAIRISSEVRKQGVSSSGLQSLSFMARSPAPIGEVAAHHTIRRNSPCPRVSGSPIDQTGRAAVSGLPFPPYGRVRRRLRYCAPLAGPDSVGAEMAACCRLSACHPAAAAICLSAVRRRQRSTGSRRRAEPGRAAGYHRPCTAASSVAHTTAYHGGGQR